MRAGFREDLAEQLARAVRDQVLIGEVFGRGDVDHDFDRAAQLIDTADDVSRGRDRAERTQPGSFLSLFQSPITAGFSGVSQLAIAERQLSAEKDQVAFAQGRGIGPRRAWPRRVR
jgi:hypothetical protein